MQKISCDTGCPGTAAGTARSSAPFLPMLPGSLLSCCSGSAGLTNARRPVIAVRPLLHDVTDPGSRPSRKHRLLLDQLIVSSLDHIRLTLDPEHNIRSFIAEPDRFLTPDILRRSHLQEQPVHVPSFFPSPRSHQDSSRSAPLPPLCNGRSCLLW